MFQLKSCMTTLFVFQYDGMQEIEDMFRRYNVSEMQAQEKMAENVGKQIMPFYVVEGVDQDSKTSVSITYLPVKLYT